MKYLIVIGVLVLILIALFIWFGLRSDKPDKAWMDDGEGE